MAVDAAWRAKIEALQNAGFDFVLADRLENLLAEGRQQEPISPISLQPTVAANRPPETNMANAAGSGSAKAAALSLLAEEVAACTLCDVLCESRTQTVFSDGNPNAELCFVGEAPGADEDAAGVPFVGRAGQLLTKIIEACKLRRDEVYICNVLKCRPPNNRNPEPNEVQNCRPYLERQLALVKPKMMVALGKFATAHLLGEPPERVPIMKLRGQVREYCGIPFMITLHPAYLLRNPAAKAEVWADMQEVMRRLGKPIK